MKAKRKRRERDQQAEQYSDKETEQRATDALRRALATPYKPHGDMIGKVGRKARPTNQK